MAYGLPTRGQADWDDELNNSMEALRGDVQSAVANASSAKSTAISAQTSADAAAASAAQSATAAETAASAATAPTDETMAAKVNDSTSQTHAALSATIASEVGTEGTAARDALNAAYGYSGTGSPEGVVTAPVGARYRDTAATNGAVLWVKATGTGNTGWKVEYGDTGWRRVVADGTIAGRPGLQVSVRRVGSYVQFLLAEPDTPGLPTTGGNMNLWNIPSGFRHAVPVGGFAGTPVMNNAAVPQSATLAANTTHQLYFYNAPATTRCFANLVLGTTDPWPAALPGTAL